MSAELRKNEENLYSELQAARKQLDAAQAQEMALIRVVGRNQGLSDGIVTLAEARLIHAEARLRYRRLLASFSSLVVGPDPLSTASNAIQRAFGRVRWREPRPPR